MSGVAAGTLGTGLGAVSRDGPLGLDGSLGSPTVSAVQAGVSPSAMYLLIDGIEGDTESRNHPNEIEVQSYTLPMSRTGGESGTRLSAPQFAPLVVHKGLDRATPRLMESFARGTHHPEAVLSLETVGDGNRVDFATITLGDVTVRSVTGGVGIENATEQVTLLYNRIQMVFLVRGSKGALGERVEFGWDVQGNRAL